MVAVALAVVPPTVGAEVGAASRSTTTVSASLTVAATNSSTLPASFWGADLRVYYPLGAAQALAYNSTPLSYVRWPGGAVADAYNLSSNVITNDDGTTYSPPSNLSLFAAWCRSVGCHAIVQLPAEIDRPATAAYEVAYVEQVVHFVPSYWELGNEPALWHHFGVAWSAWASTQSANATPTTYAAVVQAYASAIHKVDPKARLIGLPGVGTGGYGEAGWIRATVQRNGPNLSAVAIHVYPAGGSGVGGTATDFLATLAGHGSLAYRAPLDEAAIAQACPRCQGIALFVTELGSGTQGGPVDPWMGSFDDVPYLAAEAAQALGSGAANVDLFDFQGTYNGSLLNASGVGTRDLVLYADLLGLLGPAVRTVTISSTASLLYATSTVSANGSVHTLLFVNANDTLSVHLSLTGSGFPLTGAGTLTRWTAALSTPSSYSWTTSAPTALVVPPVSVLVVQVTV